MLTRSLVEFAISLDYSMIPESTVRQAKRSILDVLGVAIAGSSSPVGNSIVRYVSSLGGTPESTVIATDLKCPAPHAALAIGTMGHALDYDDSSISLSGHPTVTIFPASLTTGEKCEVDGKRLLVAFIAGFEVACKIGKVVNPEHFNKGFHPTSTLGIFGATIAAGKVLGLACNKLTHALGIAGSMASGLQENFGSATKPLHAGLAAQNGVLSAYLAKEGINSSESILEGTNGFLKAFVNKEIDSSRILAGLGTPFELTDPGLIYKLYPACSRVQAAIHGILELVKKYGLSKNVIKSVACGTDEKAHDILVFHEPKSVDECRFSMEFCLASAIVNQGMKVSDFCEESLKKKHILGLMKKIKMFVDPKIISLGYDKRSAVSIRVRLIDGKEYETVNLPKGFSENPISDNDLIGKFRDCAGPFLKKENVERTIESVFNLEKLHNVNRLIKFLVPKGDYLTQIKKVE